MKLTLFAVLSCCALANSASISSTSQAQSSEKFLKETAAQLQRLATITQRTRRQQEPLKLYAVPEEDGLAETDRSKRSHLHPISVEPIYDLESDLLMQERIKRSGGALLSGIGSAILGKIAGASRGISSSSSHSDSDGLGDSVLGKFAGASGGSSSSGHGHSVEYGPPIDSYDEKSFDIWAFKRAIFNTLFQALKAIGGGVIALKGQLVKGGGHIVTTKGRIISAGGDALTSLGRNIASSAIVSPPKHGGYSYEPPHHIESTGHDSAYGGPPPSIHTGYGATGPTGGYGHSAYGAPSDDGVQAGLLILKPMKPGHDHDSGHGGDYHEGISVSQQHQISYETKKVDHQDHGSSYQQEENYHEDVDPRHTNVAALEESFGGASKVSAVSSLLSNAAIASKGSGGQQTVKLEHGNDDYHPEHKDEQKYKTVSNYGPPNSKDQHSDDNKIVDLNGGTHNDAHVEPQYVQSSGYGTPLPTHSTNPQLHQTHSSSPQYLQAKPAGYNVPNTYLSPLQLPHDQLINFNSIRSQPSSFNSVPNQPFNFNPIPYKNFGGYQQLEQLKLPILSGTPDFYSQNYAQLNVPHQSIGVHGAYRRRSAVDYRDVQIQPSVDYAVRDAHVYRI